MDFRMQDRSTGQFSKFYDNYTVLFSAATTTREANTELANNNFKTLLCAIDKACVDKTAIGPEILLKCAIQSDDMTGHDQETATTILMQNISSLKNCCIRNTLGDSEIVDISDKFDYDLGSTYLIISQTTMKHNDSPLKGFPVYSPDKVIQDKKDFPDSNLGKGYQETVFLGNCYRRCTVFATWNVDERGRPYFTEKISETGCNVSMMTVGVIDDSNISLLTNESLHYFSTWQKCLLPEFIEELLEDFGHLFI